MNQSNGYSGRQRPGHRFSWWEYALIVVAALVVFSVGVAIVGLVMSALSQGMSGGNK